MTDVKTIMPVLITKTRSFWFGIVPTAITTLDLAFSAFAGENAVPVANAVASVAQVTGYDVTGEQIAGFMQSLYPLYLVIFAQQRGTFSGAIPRPYTVSPKKEKTIATFIENGKTAFEAGQALSRMIKR